MEGQRYNLDENHGDKIEWHVCVCVCVGRGACRFNCITRPHVFFSLLKHSVVLLAWEAISVWEIFNFSRVYILF